MSDLQEQAAAIWKTLDDMSSKDPTAYQKFIQEQLSEGDKFFKANTTTIAGNSCCARLDEGSIKIGSGNKAAAAVVTASGFNPLDFLSQLTGGGGDEFEGLASASESGSSKSKAAGAPAGAKASGEGKSKLDSKLGSKDPPQLHSLSDDNFKMASMLSSIVALDDNDNVGEDELKLKLPNAEVDKKKPLIEEL